MRYPASEKLEIIRTVEASHLPTRQTLKLLGIPSSTYYDWYARWSDGGLDALADRSPRPGSVWNRIPDKVREDDVDFALACEDLTPRELAVKYTDEKRYFVSETSVYRILGAEDLIAAAAHVVIRAADEFRDKTVRPNELRADRLHLSQGDRLPGSAADVIHAFVSEPVGQLAGDVAAAIVAEQPRSVGDRGPVAVRGDQGIFQRGGDIRRLHRGAEPPGDDVAAIIVEDRRQVEPAVVPQARLRRDRRPSDR